MQLIKLEPKGIFVFVGDTHGDVNMSEFIIREYLKPNHKLVFLGDYVDRGPQSKNNIDYLLKERKRHPLKIYLLQGNHEGHMVHKMNNIDADFWIGLRQDEMKKYGKIFGKLPLALSVGDILAVHSTPPNLNSLKDFYKIKNGDDNWNDIVWTDFAESTLEAMDYGRECIFKKEFDERMKQLNKRLLIRSHNARVRECIYNEKCVTIFTSRAYKDRKSTIAIADFTKHKRIQSAKDLEIRVL